MRSCTRILAILFFPLVMAASCGPHLTSNKYKDAKTHPSDILQKQNKAAAKQARKDFKKQQKLNQKAISKNSRPWQKKARKMKSQG